MHFAAAQYSLILVQYALITAGIKLRKVLFLALSVCGFLSVRNMSGTVEQICTKFTWKTCLVPGLDEFEGQGQSSRSQRQNTPFFGPYGSLSVVLCLVKHL